MIEQQPDWQKQVDADQDIGYECAFPIPDGTIDLYTNRQLEELNKFMHIHEQIDKVRDEVDKGGNVGWFLKVDKEKGTVNQKDLVFMMNGKLLYVLQHIADNMYHGHDETLIDGSVLHIPGFIDNPLMKEAADGFLIGRSYDKRLAREFEIGELNSWFEAE